MIYEKIKDDLKGLFDRSEESFGMLALNLAVGKVPAVAARLKEEFAFDLFLDVTAVDYPERALRFDLIYHFYSPKHKVRIRLKATVAEAEAEAPTLTGLYGSARFMEREVREMYGIDFPGNDDLRPILLYEGFSGHPLRKDYPIDLEQPLVPYRK